MHSTSGAAAEAFPGPEDWFGLLSRFPRDRASVAAVERARHDGGVRTALLQAARVAAPRVAALPVDAAVKRQILAIFDAIARPKPPWEGYFDDPFRFDEMARYVTLRRFPAGQHDWELQSLPWSWLLKVDPRRLPALAGEIFGGLGGFGPLAAVHLNHFRRNAVILLDTEARRSWHRIARSVALQPRVAGLMGASWFFSREAAAETPRLAWLRGFFVDNGAFLVDMEPATPANGFTVGSAARARAYAEGRFAPRMTLVLWRRSRLLDWAARHPEYADPETPE